jgi:hypothetical protein
MYRPPAAHEAYPVTGWIAARCRKGYRIAPHQPDICHCESRTLRSAQSGFLLAIPETCDENGAHLRSPQWSFR